MMNQNQKAIIETENTDVALALAREQGGVMAHVGSEVLLIPAIDKPFRYRLPRLGKIHLGVKVQKQGPKGTVEYPRATDHFVLSDELKADPDFRALLEGMGEDPDKPNRLPIMLPCNAIGDNLRTSCDLYGLSKGLVCRSLDGVTAHRVNQTTGELVQGPCAGEQCGDFAKGDCHWIHRLRVILPDAPGVGVWQVDTSSPNNRANLLTEMKQMKFMLGGRLAGIDLFLTLEPQEFQVPMKPQGGGEPQVRKTIAYLMHIRSEMSLRKLQVAAKEAVAYEDAEIEQFDDHPNDAPVVEGVEAEEEAQVSTWAEEAAAEPATEAVEDGRLEVVVAEEVQTGPPPCGGCRGEIKGSTLGGRSYTASEIVDLTVAEMGSAHCPHCYAAWKIKNRQADQSAAPPAEEQGSLTGDSQA